MARPAKATLLPVFLALFLAACSRKVDAPAASKPPTPVRVRVVEERTSVAGAKYSGNVEPGTRVDLAFKVGGYVRELASIKVGNEKRKIQEGDFV
ncbi:MAG TPA: hypothetical protein VM580_28425 [Labilithrix sp.]|nr:hypothetical protein [Labilithrix sp.]